MVCCNDKMTNSKERSITNTTSSGPNSGGSLQIGLKFNTFQSGKFLNLRPRMVSVIYQKSQKHREKKKQNSL